MTPLDLAWAVAVGVALLGAVGVPLAGAVGLRGYWMIAAAPAFAITIIGGAAVIAPWIGLTWSILPVAVVAVVVGAAIFVVRRRLARNAPSSPRARIDWWLLGALVAATLVLGLRVLQIIGAPDHISQTFDNIFHLNGVRFALDTANASSLHVGSMTSPGGSLPFYPAGWHAVTSLVVQLSGVGIPVAVNAVTLIVSAAIWPISIMVLSRTLFGRQPAIAVATALLAVSIPAFPILLMDYGVLYPFQLGLAVLPVALAATLNLLRLGMTHSPSAWGWWALVLVGVIPGMTIAHPGAFVAWLALSAPMAVVFAWNRFRAARNSRGRVVVVILTVAYAASGAALVRVLRPPPEARGWPVQMGILDAAWQVLSVSTWYLVPAIAVSLCIAAGIAWAIIERKRAPLIALAVYVVGAVLFITVASLPLPQLRDLLTGSWYNNLPRLAAIAALPMVPLGAYGLARTWTAVLSLPALHRASSHLPRMARGVIAVAVAVLVGFAMQGPAIQRAVEWASPLYRLDASSPLLTIDEYTLLLRLDQSVPAGVRVAGSPWTGASLAYALADRPVLMPHTLMEISDDIETINDGLDTAQPGDPVCRAVADLDVGFVLDFGRQEVHPVEHPFPGLDDLATAPGVRLVDSEGSARLYEIIACD